MATFGLVHGVCAGAWSWDLLTPYLEEAGHDVVAVDLPSDEPEATFSDYARLVDQALAPATDEIVLVGHSTGGFTIPLVAAQRPVRELVYLCATIPVPGEAVAEHGVDWGVVDPVDWQVYNSDGSFSITPDGFRRHVAQDVDPALADEITARLRPQFLTPFTERCPLDAMPDVARRYILCREDHIVNPEWSRRVAAERLGVEAVELPGSHSPMASRPDELANILLSGSRSALMAAG
jgi:pimeloyl-ACP methyl ester carboxylesterase